MTATAPAMSHRSCYVNFAEHLQNAWNPNMYYPGAPNRWSRRDWAGFLAYLKACGFTCFEYWVSPTLFDLPALEGGGIYREFAETMQLVNAEAHAIGLRTHWLAAVNTISPKWYFACPKIPRDKADILALWRHWSKALVGTDIVGIFPGDPGGCARNGCDHETYIDLALELVDVIHRENPDATIHLSTWGTPFSGWGEDQWTLPDSDGTWTKITSRGASPGEPMHIWNGKPERARRAIDYMIRRLEHFPADTMVAINLGFDPDGGATMGGDAKPLAREVAKVRPITTWDYSLAEGELVAYPHWRLPRMAARRREERAAAPYRGAMSYTMSPKLNLLTLWAAGRIMQNPDADPDKLSREFCAAAFGAEHAELGELFEAFEVVPGWGHYPRRRWSKSVLRGKYREMIDRLEAADPGRCGLPLFPPIETYRDDLLWFARRFEEMAGPDPDREAIKKAYWARALTIYDHIPMSADARAEAAAKSFSSTLGRDGTWGGSWG